jgi:hypothetical protein
MRRKLVVLVALLAALPLALASTAAATAWDARTRSSLQIE